MWYNSAIMPTPFSHLRLLTNLMQEANTWFPPDVVRKLKASRGPFLLGGTAPDVRKISPVSREETHFYPTPPDPVRPSMQAMLHAWPELADPGKLDLDHVLFIAGYLAHLWFDEYWHMTIVYPYYVQRDDWGTHRGRFDIYNVLLGYLDIRDRRCLGDSLGELGYLRFQLIFGHCLGDQTNSLGFFTRYRVAGEHHHLGPLQSGVVGDHVQWQGHSQSAYLGKHKCGVFGSDDDIALAGNIQPASNTVAMHLGDYRLASMPYGAHLFVCILQEG